MRCTRVTQVLVIAALVATFAACRADGPARSPVALTDDTITVGSFDFAESELLAEIYSQAMEAQGFHVRRAVGLGPREFVAPAFEAGLVEFIPEYAGTALQFATLGRSRPGSQIATTHDALTRELADHDVTVLASAPAQDANAFVVTREVAATYDLHRISDLSGLASALTLGGPPECERRPLCLPGLELTYGLTFKEFVALDTAGPLTHAALADGSVDVALLFTTDPGLATADLVALADDRALQPAENVTPLVRTGVLDRAGPAFARTVDAVSAQLTTEALRSLNAQMANAQTGNTPGKRAAIAAHWLEAAGLR
jgi:osmoprotectant transport system substrate-binding protein